MYVNFYSQVGTGSRVPEDNSWDRGRPAVDGTLFPLYEAKIVSASLTLDENGLGGDYGSYAIFLREGFIAHRTTVFEENPFLFMKRHAVVAGTAIPNGYRATWSSRGDLSRAKLHSKLSSTTSPADFPSILCDRSGSDPDFIEAHIYGAISPKAIAKIVAPKPQTGSDAAIHASLAKKLRTLGAEFQEHK